MTYVEHAFEEQLFDTGEVHLNYEDPPLFASEVGPAVGPGLRHAIGPLFALMANYLGDQWSIGDWDAMVAAAPDELPTWLHGQDPQLDVDTLTAWWSGLDLPHPT